MKRPCLLILLTVTFLLIERANAENIWDAWDRELRRQCPSHHVEWICGDCYDDLMAAFEKTLPANTQRKMPLNSDYAHRCATETMGFYCEMFVFLDAAARLGLLKRFAAFACRRYRCEEPALCTQN